MATSPPWKRWIVQTAVFAQTVAADGSPGYWSVLIVNKDSPINNLNDMLAKRKELTFGNGDPNSTSGFGAGLLRLRQK